MADSENPNHKGSCIIWIVLFVITLIIACICGILYLRPIIFKPKTETFVNTNTNLDPNKIIYRKKNN